MFTNNLATGPKSTSPAYFLYNVKCTEALPRKHKKITPHTHTYTRPLLLLTSWNVKTAIIVVLIVRVKYFPVILIKFSGNKLYIVGCLEACCSYRTYHRSTWTDFRFQCLASLRSYYYARESNLFYPRHFTE